MPYTYEFPRPAVTADCVVLSLDERGALQVLLIQRGRDPFAGRWALPGGFVDQGEDLEPAARRELQEETGLSVGHLEQLGAFGKPGRDPRGHTVTVAWLALARAADLSPEAADDAAGVGWFPLDELPPMAFDHADILAAARRRLQERARVSPLLLALLPETFSLAQAADLHARVLGAADPERLRERLQGAGAIEPRGDLYRADPDRLARLAASGYDLSL